MKPLPGRFQLGPATTIHLADPRLNPVATRELQRLRASTGLELPVVLNEPADIVISSDASLPPEGYRLVVTPEAVRIQAADAAALFYAFQSIRQLLPPEVECERLLPDVDWSLPAVEILDYPRFPYRGMHLDVSRHFFDVEFVKRFIDLMSRYKFNRFHWHLTDDHGWRIMISAYPRLTEVGAWRSETAIGNNVKVYIGDGIPHGRLASWKMCSQKSCICFPASSSTSGRTKSPKISGRKAASRRMSWYARGLPMSASYRVGSSDAWKPS